jgi:hypothetical protein
MFLPLVLSLECVGVSGKLAALCIAANQTTSMLHHVNKCNCNLLSQLIATTLRPKHVAPFCQPPTNHSSLRLSLICSDIACATPHSATSHSDDDGNILLARLAQNKSHWPTDFITTTTPISRIHPINLSLHHQKTLTRPIEGKTPPQPTASIATTSKPKPKTHEKCASPTSPSTPAAAAPATPSSSPATKPCTATVICRPKRTSPTTTTTRTCAFAPSVSQHCRRV